MLSEKIADEIMSEIHETVKDFVSETIANRKRVSFDEIERQVSELKESFGKRLSEGALEAIGSGHVGQRMDCKCGGTLEYHSNRRWKLTSLNGKLEIYRAYYYCESCKTGFAPLDDQLGLEGKHHSIGVRKKVALEASSEPFQETSKRLKELIDIDVSSKETQLESEELGREVGSQEDAEVEAFWSEEKDIETEVNARRLYITADGTIVPTDEGGKEVKIGSVYETPETRNGLANDIRYTGGFHNSEHFGKKLYVLALIWGLRTGRWRQMDLEACEPPLPRSHPDCGLLPCHRAPLVIKPCYLWRRHKSLQGLGKKADKVSPEREGGACHQFPFRACSTQRRYCGRDRRQHHLFHQQQRSDAL